VEKESSKKVGRTPEKETTAIKTLPANKIHQGRNGNVLSAPCPRRREKEEMEETLFIARGVKVNSVTMGASPRKRRFTRGARSKLSEDSVEEEIRKAKKTGDYDICTEPYLLPVALASKIIFQRERRKLC